MFGFGIHADGPAEAIGPPLRQPNDFDERRDLIQAVELLRAVGQALDRAQRGGR
jgi:hypothetical protein